MDFSEFFNYDGQTAQGSGEQFVFLPDLSTDEWERILAVTQRHVFGSGDVVVHQGEVTRSLYIVARGELNVEFADERGRGHVVSTIGALSVFGEQAFFDGLPRAATVRATQPAEVHLLTREAFDSFAARDPDLARQLLLDLGRIVSLRLREITSIAMRRAH